VNGIEETTPMDDESLIQRPILIASADADVCRRIRVAMEGEGYQCITAPDGVTALALLNEESAGIVLAETDLEGLGGLELLEQVEAHCPDAYVILMAGPEEVPAIAVATSVGTSDFLPKPFTVDQLVMRVRDAERRKADRPEPGRRESDQSIGTLSRRYRALTDGIMTALSAIIDRSHPETYSHSRRVALRAAALAAELGAEPEIVRSIYIAGILHDLGKITLAPGLLDKSGKLDQAEIDHIRLHPETSDRIVSSVGLSPVTLAAIRHHHEWYDGTGYPDRLTGEGIPFGARVLAICDAYDAMISERAYREALTTEESMLRLRNGAGTQFDPRMVTVFQAMSEEHGL
jgi:putative two-component system response regulator